MPAAGTHVFKQTQFTHNGATYDVMAYQKPNDPRLYVIAELSGTAVLFTYADGSKASIVHYVEPMTAVSFRQATGNSAVDDLMATAEADVRRMI